ncbi:MAG: HPr family phosphocarrier protein [Firmicutes bacterium HGW-Firmicutes-3]|jgi:phosphocarrier protein|nr:MAG: HPr family phosphocarrier protein [Firmicutes bacterium HGW-Firmicutes-3]
MKKFNYIIKDQIGIHARPASLLVKKAQKYESKVTIESKGESSDAKKLMAVLSMGIKCGDEVIITIEGNDENQVYTELPNFFSEHL